MRGVNYYRELYAKHSFRSELLPRESPIEECNEAELMLQGHLLRAFKNKSTSAHVYFDDPVGGLITRALNCAIARLNCYDGLLVRKEQFNSHFSSGTRVILEYSHK